MDKNQLLQIRSNLDNAHKMVSDLCHVKRTWTMSIPARPGYDPDLVIGQALRDAERMFTILSSDAEQRNGAVAGQGTALRNSTSDDCEHEWLPAGEQVLDEAKFCPKCRTVRSLMDTDL